MSTQAEICQQKTRQKKIDTAEDPKLKNSKDKVCNICYEHVIEKEDDSRFGILSNCNHCFCLTCIKQWRLSSKNKDNFVKACPVCRIESNLIYPSKYWVSTSKEKELLVENYGKLINKRIKKLEEKSVEIESLVMNLKERYDEMQHLIQHGKYSTSIYHNKNNKGLKRAAALGILIAVTALLICL